MIKGAILGGLAGAVLLGGLATWNERGNQNPVDASFQLEDFCSATSVYDFDLTDTIDNGVFFTAAHCVNDKPIGHIFTVKNQTGEYRVQLMAFDDKRDVAYLQTLTAAPEGLARLQIDTTPLAVGEEVTMLGYPFGFSAKAITKGIAGEAYDFGDGVPDNYILASIAGGFSGGTLVDEDGYFAGVVTGALLGQFETHSGFAFATRPEEIREFIDAQLGVSE